MSTALAFETRHDSASDSGDVGVSDAEFFENLDSPPVLVDSTALKPGSDADFHVSSGKLAAEELTDAIGRSLTSRFVLTVKIMVLAWIRQTFTEREAPAEQVVGPVVENIVDSFHGRITDASLEIAREGAGSFVDIELDSAIGDLVAEVEQDLSTRDPMYLLAGTTD